MAGSPSPDLPLQTLKLLWRHPWVFSLPTGLGSWFTSGRDLPPKGSDPSMWSETFQPSLCPRPHSSQAGLGWGCSLLHSDLRSPGPAALLSSCHTRGQMHGRAVSGGLSTGCSLLVQKPTHAPCQGSTVTRVVRGRTWVLQALITQAWAPPFIGQLNTQGIESRKRGLFGNNTLEKERYLVTVFSKYL